MIGFQETEPELQDRIPGQTGESSIRQRGLSKLKGFEAARGESCRSISSRMFQDGECVRYDFHRNDLDGLRVMRRVAIDLPEG